VGALRDVVQNHLMQVVSNIAMEPPPCPDVESIRDERAKVLRSTQSLEPDGVVVGQFAGYQDEPGVKRGSNVETFVMLRLHINSWRWRDVPFYIRAGKLLPVTATEVIARFHHTPPVFSEELTPQNYFRFRLSPAPATAIGASIKQAGDRLLGCMTELTVDEACGTDDLLPYEELLQEAMHGNQAWFAREDYVEESWRILDPVIKNPPEPLIYQPGAWGPVETGNLPPPSGGWWNPKP
jgi:glucose-6-phosphate 1-dehydrogenase